MGAAATLPFAGHGLGEPNIGRAVGILGILQRTTAKTEAAPGFLPNPDCGLLRGCSSDVPEGTNTANLKILMPETPKSSHASMPSVQP